MSKLKKFVTTLTPKIEIINTTMNDLPEEIIAKILEGTPRNEIPNSRLISKHYNSSITTWFGTTLSYSDINRGSRLPQSLWQGHVTILKLGDYISLNSRNFPPLPRLRMLEIGGKMRLQTLVGILGESINLRQVSIKFPTILDLDFDVTMALDELPARIEAIEILIHEDEPEIGELSLLQVFSQLPLSSLEKFTCLYKEYEEEDELSRAMVESTNDLSSLIKVILTKCMRTLRDLSLSRPYNWPEDLESPPIEEEFKLKALRLLWDGESRWLRSLIEPKRTQSGLESLIISCNEDLWVQGVVQRVALASRATLKRLTVDLNLRDDQIIEDEFTLGFLSQLSKLEKFYIRSERGFIFNQGRRELRLPLPPLILPPTLKEVFLSAPITFQTLQSFCALPALEEFTLEDFIWVDWPTYSAILTEIENIEFKKFAPSVLLDWNWFKNLLINCPSLKSIKFKGCVFETAGIILTVVNLSKKWKVLSGLHFEYLNGDLIMPPNVPDVYLLGSTISIRTDRPNLDGFILKLNEQ